VPLELHATLKPGGVLFSSNPHGHNEEGWQHGRYEAYHDLETWRRYMSAAGFVELTYYYRRGGLPREHSLGWLASGADWCPEEYRFPGRCFDQRQDGHHLDH
jgi:hypothetical protein